MLFQLFRCCLLFIIGFSDLRLCYVNKALHMEGLLNQKSAFECEALMP